MTPVDSPPRKLTTHQKAVLIQVLLTFPDQAVGICFCSSVDDALPYAQDFLAIFKAIGWKVTDPEAREIAMGSPAGLALVFSRAGSLPPAAEALRDALRIYEIDAEILCDPGANIPLGSFVVAVGSAARE
jgi:hypothetical protein